jgi:hypothetical protein
MGIDPHHPINSTIAVGYPVPIKPPPIAKWNKSPRKSSCPFNNRPTELPLLAKHPLLDIPIPLLAKCPRLDIRPINIRPDISILLQGTASIICRPAKLPIKHHS